jgi:RNA polymerase sigma factor (TIGR02999 family)
MRDKVCSDGETFGRLFAEAQGGSQLAQNLFYGMTFRRLRSIALTLLRKERAGHTLQPTALVSEMFLKFRARGTRILGEEHFFRVAARAMQQVLIDSARAKFALKRIPPELVAEFLSSASPSGVDTELCLAVRMVLEKLRQIDPVAAETVWLRFVEGLTIEEVSRSQARDFWRVRADCDFGLRWMAEQLELTPASRRAAPFVAESLTL